MREVQHLPADLGLVSAAYLCDLRVRRVPGDGEWEFEVVREVTGGLDRLLEAYAKPDETTDAHQVCPAIPHPSLHVTLHGKSIVAARVPQQVCGAPDPEAAAAFEALTTRVIEETRTRQVTSELASASGCSEEHKNVLVIERAVPGTTPEPLAPRPHLVCTYAVTVDGMGGLLAAARLPVADVRRVSAALADSRRDDSCGRTKHRRFAVVRPADDHGATMYVALDGCAVQQGVRWWRASEELRQLLR